MHLFNKLPLDLAMSLMDHPEASHYFSCLPELQQKEIIRRAHQMGSAEQIEQYVRELPKQA